MTTQPSSRPCMPDAQLDILATFPCDYAYSNIKHHSFVSLCKSQNRSGCKAVVTSSNGVYAKKYCVLFPITEYLSINVEYPFIQLSDHCLKSILVFYDPETMSHFLSELHGYRRQFVIDDITAFDAYQTFFYSFPDLPSYENKENKIFPLIFQTRDLEPGYDIDYAAYAVSSSEPLCQQENISTHFQIIRFDEETLEINNLEQILSTSNASIVAVAFIGVSANSGFSQMATKIIKDTLSVFNKSGKYSLAGAHQEGDTLLCVLVVTSLMTRISGIAVAEYHHMLPGCDDRASVLVRFCIDSFSICIIGSSFEESRFDKEYRESIHQIVIKNQNLSCRIENHDLILWGGANNSNAKPSNAFKGFESCLKNSNSLFSYFYCKKPSNLSKMSDSTNFEGGITASSEISFSIPVFDKPKLLQKYQNLISQRPKPSWGVKLSEKFLYLETVSFYRPSSQSITITATGDFPVMFTFEDLPSYLHIFPRSGLIPSGSHLEIIFTVIVTERTQSIDPILGSGKCDILKLQFSGARQPMFIPVCFSFNQTFVGLDFDVFSRLPTPISSIPSSVFDFQVYHNENSMLIKNYPPKDTLITEISLLLDFLKRHLKIPDLFVKSDDIEHVLKVHNSLSTSRQPIDPSFSPHAVASMLLLTVGGSKQPLLDFEATTKKMTKNTSFESLMAIVPHELSFTVASLLRFASIYAKTGGKSKDQVYKIQGAIGVPLFFRAPELNWDLFESASSLLGKILAITE